MDTYDFLQAIIVGLVLGLALRIFQVKRRLDAKKNGNIFIVAIIIASVLFQMADRWLDAEAVRPWFMGGGVLSAAVLLLILQKVQTEQNNQKS